MPKLPKTTLYEILHGYPRFYDKSPDSNHHKYNKVISEAVAQLKTAKYLVKKALDINRPIRIWKEQVQPHDYEMNFEVKIEDIKKVEIFKEPDELLHSSGELPIGTDEYTHSFRAISPEIIPSTQYYLEVETYNEIKLTKGFPENDEVKGDKYDHDMSLDVFGSNLRIYRRKFKAPEEIDEEDLPYTVPPYNNSLTEDDYHYEERIKTYMSERGTVSLPILELKKYFDINADIIGRWRHLCRQNVHLQNQMFMATANWNSATFDILVDIGKVPKNIDPPSGETIEAIVTESFPLSKKAFFSFIYTDPEFNKQDVELLVERINLYLQMKHEYFSFMEQVSGSVEYPDSSNITSIVEKFQTNISLGEYQVPSLIESYAMTAFDLLLSQDTDSEFSGGTHSSTYVSGYGSAAKVQIDTSTKTTTKYPGSTGQTTGDGCDDFGWAYRDRIKANDGVYSDSYATATGWSYWIYGTSFGFGIPSNAEVTGLWMRSKHYNNSQRHWFNHKIWCGGYTAIFKYPNTVPGRSGSYTEYTGIMEWAIGGNGNNLGIPWAALTPANVNAMSFGFASSLYTSGRSVYLDYILASVYWRYKSGTYTTPVITADPEGYEWDKIKIAHTIPAGCSILYDVLKASDNTVLLENQTGTEIDISSLDYVNLKVRAKMTANGGTSPSIDSIKVYNKRHYGG